MYDFVSWALSFAILPWLGAAQQTPSTPALRCRNQTITAWQPLGENEGLPAGRVLCVREFEGGLWIGTTQGLVRAPRGASDLEKARTRTISTDQGLANAFVTAVEVDEDTADVWIGTLGGLSRYSAGRIQTFRKANSGLASDLVYDVCAHRGHVWIATASGCSRYDVMRDRWEVYDGTNSPVADLLGRSIAACGDRVFVGLFGGGVVEFDTRSEQWSLIRDPDGHVEYDALPTDGLIADFVTAVDCADETSLFVGTPFGLSIRHGTKWAPPWVPESLAPAGRVRCLLADGQRTWIGTDAGLAVYDQSEHRVCVVPGAPSGAINNIERDAHGLWLATDAGLVRGEFERAASPSPTQTARPTDSHDATASSGTTPKNPDSEIPFWNDVTPHQWYFQHPVSGSIPVEPLRSRQDRPLRVGFLLPTGSSPHAEMAAQLRDGATFAFEEFHSTEHESSGNAHLVIRRGPRPWHASSDDVVSLVQEHGIHALLGPADCSDALIALQAAAQLHIPMVNVACTDPTLNRTNLPWLVSVLPNDRTRAAALAWHIVEERGFTRVALLRSSSRYGQVGAAQMREALGKLGCSVLTEMKWNPGDLVFTQQIAQIRSLGAQSVVLWGNAHDVERIVKVLSQSRSQLAVFGCDRLGETANLDGAATTAPEFTFVAGWDPSVVQDEIGSFSARFHKRFGYKPGPDAAHAYNGAALLLRAWREVGTDSDHIRDWLFRQRSWSGVSGEITFDRTYGNVGDVFLVKSTDQGFDNRRVDWTAMPVFSPGLVMRRMLRRAGPATSTQEPEVIAIGCVIGPDDEGQAFERGASLAILQYMRSRGAGPSLSLRIRRLSGDWSRSAASLADLVYEDGALAILARASDPVREQLRELSSVEQLPVLWCGRGKEPRPGDEDSWMISPESVGNPTVEFEKAFAAEYGDNPPPEAWTGFAVASRVIRRLADGATSGTSRLRAILRGDQP